MTMKNKNNPKPMGLSKSSSMREFYSNTIYIRKQEKSKKKNLNRTSKATRKRTDKTQH